MAQAIRIATRPARSTAWRRIRAAVQEDGQSNEEATAKTAAAKRPTGVAITGRPAAKATVITPDLLASVLETTTTSWRSMTVEISHSPTHRLTISAPIASRRFRRQPRLSSPITETAKGKFSRRRISHASTKSGSPLYCRGLPKNENRSGRPAAGWSGELAMRKSG